MTPIIIQLLPLLAALLLIPAILAAIIPPTEKEARRLYLRRPIVKNYMPILDDWRR